MNPNRKHWNEGHQKLNRALAAANRETATELFLVQHAMVHSTKMAKIGLWSFEEEVPADLSDDQIRTIPRGGEHSIAWIMFHLARVEDITMNMLVAGTLQLFTQEEWAKKINVEIIHYRASRTIAGLLLMPPTRRCFLHWNEALKIKKKIEKEK